jgi:hypothetical protein
MMGEHDCSNRKPASPLGERSKVLSGRLRNEKEPERTTWQGAIFAAEVEATAQMYHPLSAKSELQIREPWAWKGGAMATFMKTAAIIPTFDDMRAVLVSDVAGER